MKNIYLLVISFLLGKIAFSQGLTQTSEGESSLLFKGTNISLDIVKTNLSFGANNLNKTIGANNRYFIGTDIVVKNEEGIGQLFSAGKLVPTAKANFFGGWSWSNGVLPNYNETVLALANKKIKIETGFETDFYSKIEKIIMLHTVSEQESFRKELIDAIKAKEPISTFKTRLNDKSDDSGQSKKSKTEISKWINDLEKERDNQLGKIDKQLQELSISTSKKSYFQIMPFAFGGISASEFKRFSVIDTANYKNSFSDEYFRGGYIGFGVNAQWRFINFGFTYSYKETNNFDALTKKEYSYKQTLTNGNQSLTEEKKIEAYSGDYGKVRINELKADLVFNFKLDPEALNHILVNPYIQSRVHSRNKELLPNTVNVGCGFYFYNNKGKFLGGFYTELPDVENNLEKAKPLVDQNLRDPLKRITFGVVGKFSFNSLLNLFGQSN